MKNHRFPWLRNRTTDNRKCEKARNIKEKRTIEMFNTALIRVVCQKIWWIAPLMALAATPKAMQTATMRSASAATEPPPRQRMT